MLLNQPIHHLQRGISLIESLVAIVIMALGILGILGVQMRTLTDTQAGVRRAQAIRLIEDLGERIQNNPDAINNLSAYTQKPTSSTNCAATACPPSALATFDILNWRATVASSLPGGDAIVFIPQENSNRQLGVLIGWSENRYSQSGKDLTAEAAELNYFLHQGASGTDSAGAAVSCPDKLICHIQYIQPTQRCTPWGTGGGVLYCPN